MRPGSDREDGAAVTRAAVTAARGSKMGSTRRVEVTAKMVKAQPEKRSKTCSLENVGNEEITKIHKTQSSVS